MTVTVLYERNKRVTVKEKTVLEIYEEKRALVKEFNLTSDLFACKVFEDVAACQELCRLLLRDKMVALKSVRTQYVIRNLETHSMELDILAERKGGGIVGIEIQMYEESAPLKRTRYYLSGIDMSILEKGQDYDRLPTVTMVYLTDKDFIGGGRGSYLIERKLGDRESASIADIGKRKAFSISNGVRERYYNLECPTGDEGLDELFAYFKDSDPNYKTETFPRIVERVRHFKTHEKGVNIMCKIADRIREEGREEGRLEGMMEVTLELLEELGQVPQQIVELINAQDSMEILSRWLKNAAKAETIAEFEANM